MKKKITPKKSTPPSPQPITHAVLKQELARELKQFVKEIDEMHRRHMGALSEQFQDQVSAVAEQFLSLNEKVDVTKEKVDSLDKKVDSLDKKVDSLDKKVDSLDKKVDSHTEMIGGMMEDIEVIKSNVEFLKAGMKTKVDYPDYHSLERRVRLIESKLRR